MEMIWDLIVVFQSIWGIFWSFLWQISLAVWVFVVVAVGLNLFTMKWHTKIAFCCLMMVADGY